MNQREETRCKIQSSIHLPHEYIKREKKGPRYRHIILQGNADQTYYLSHLFTYDLHR